MNQLQRPLLESLLRIRNLTEFAAFKNYLVDEQKRADQMLRDANDDRTMRLLQGEARCIQKLIKLIEDSAGILDKERPH
jgi:hypothetical protein